MPAYIHPDFSRKYLSSKVVYTKANQDTFTTVAPGVIPPVAVRAAMSFHPLSRHAEGMARWDFDLVVKVVKGR